MRADMDVADGAALDTATTTETATRRPDDTPAETRRASTTEPSNGRQSGEDRRERQKPQKSSKVATASSATLHSSAGRAPDSLTDSTTEATTASAANNSSTEGEAPLTGCTFCRLRLLPNHFISVTLRAIAERFAPCSVVQFLEIKPIVRGNTARSHQVFPRLTTCNSGIDERPDLKRPFVNHFHIFQKSFLARRAEVIQRVRPTPRLTLRSQIARIVTAIKEPVSKL